MKTIAQINADEAGELVDFLKNQRFSYSTKSTTDEGGIDVIEFLVDEQDYESVSSAVDEWQAKMVAKAEEQSYSRCPSCDSHHLEYTSVGSNETLTKLPVIYRCKNCGRIFAPRR